MKIHGVGQAKANKYGEQFIAIIRSYCEQNNLHEIADTRIASSKASTKPTQSLSGKTEDIVEKFDQGHSIQALVEQNKIKTNTVYNHLYKYVDLGHKLKHPERLTEAMNLPDTLVEKGIDAFKEHGSARLKPIFETLNEQATYDQIHLLRIYFLHEAK